jgi:hypothetical protein
MIYGYDTPWEEKPEKEDDPYAEDKIKDRS